MPDRPHSRRVTLRDIASRLGVTHVTVSLALRNDPQISTIRRGEIQRLAQEMGYRPDPMLNALASYRHHIAPHPISAELAWINYWEEPRELHSYREFALYWKGACQAAEHCGYRLEEFACGNCLSPSRLEKILLARNIRGILIPPHRIRCIPRGWDKIRWEEFAIVRFGYSMLHPPAHVVALDQWNAGLVAFENIRKRGYERIGYVTGLTTTTCIKAGFLARQLEENDTLQIPVLVLPARPDGSHESTVLYSWLKKYRPDAIFTDITSVRTMLEQGGHRIPEEIGLAGCSVLDGNADAGIDQNSMEIGIAAAETLIALMNRNYCDIRSAHRELLIKGQWVDGKTLPDRTPARLTC